MRGRIVFLLFASTCLAVAVVTAAMLWWSGEEEDPETWMAGVDSTNVPLSMALPLRRAHESVRFDPAVPSPFSAAGAQDGASPGRRR